MKVLLVSVKSEKSKGGIAVWTKYYLNFCERLGLESDVVNTEAVGNIAINSTTKRNLKDEFIRFYRIYKQLNKYLKEKDYDVAHFNTSIGLFGIIRDYYIAKKIVREGIPLLLHFHCDIPYWIRNPLIRYYLKKILGLSKINLVLCQNSYQYLKQEFNIESVIIPNFIDSYLINEQKNIRENLETICFVGRVSVAKGAREIFKIAEEFPEIKFKLAGEVSEEVISWKRLENIEFLGMMEHNKIIELLDEADIFLFPSYTEGFSLALAESMARGVPAIATDVGANINMLENQGGIVVKIGDINEIKLAIEKMKDFNIRNDMSKWCIKKVKDNYTINNVILKIKKQYKRIIEEKKCLFM